MKSIIPIFLIILCCACQKKSSAPPDPGKVTITITSPTQGSIYRAMDTIAIVADVAYTDEMHGYEVKVTDSATGDILYDKAEHTHTDHFAIAEKWQPGIAKELTLKLTITAAVDHSGVDARKVLTFKLKP